jgi:hypothetical protein
MKRRGRPPADQPKSRRGIYLAMEDADLVWDTREVKQFDEMWAEGIDITDIAKRFKRDPDEVLVLALDRARKGYINSRPGSIWGNQAKRRRRA